jgi:hypothetical protein
MGIKTGYKGYKAYDYLTPGEDYVEFDLTSKDRIPEWLVPLTPEQETRMLRLAEEKLIVSMHEHPVYNPKDLNYIFTPYVTLGLGVFSFNPYTFTDAGEKTYLSPLLTEGQNTQYSTMALCVPFGVGFKYSINPKTNLSFEVVHRFTTTDYLDDVSTTYAGENIFPLLANGKESPAYLLQDRSYETGPRLGVAGKQRGFSEQKDQYLFAELAISFSFSSYRCANPR